MMKKEEKIRAAKLIHEKARYYRGSFLNSVACIEHDLAHFLTEYFCTSDPEKQRLFYEEIAASGNLSLDRKRRLLEMIVKKDYPHYWEENKEVLFALQKIQKFRNKLAHSIVDVSDSALARPLEEGIGFIDWEDAKPLKKADFDDLDADTTMVYSCLKELRRFLPSTKAESHHEPKYR
jgi:hypothetical protein